MDAYAVFMTVMQGERSGETRRKGLQKRHDRPLLQWGWGLAAMAGLVDVVKNIF